MIFASIHLGIMDSSIFEPYWECGKHPQTHIDIVFLPNPPADTIVMKTPETRKSKLLRRPSLK